MQCTDVGIAVSAGDHDLAVHLRSATYVPVETWVANVRTASGRKFSKSVAGYYREIWTKFGLHPGEVQTSWTEAYAEVRGGSVGERMVDADFKRALANATPEQKREQFTALARD
jgi:hypothetical protein